MPYWLFASEAEAEAAQQLILLLGSRAIASELGMARRADGVVAEGVRDGLRVPIHIERWDVPRICAEGWVIAAPYGWMISPSLRMWDALIDGDAVGTATELGLPPLSISSGIHSGRDWTLAVMSAANLPVTDIASPTFPEVSA